MGRGEVASLKFHTKVENVLCPFVSRQSRSRGGGKDSGICGHEDGRRKRHHSAGTVPDAGKCRPESDEGPGLVVLTLSWSKDQSRSKQMKRYFLQTALSTIRKPCLVTGKEG